MMSQQIPSHAKIMYTGPAFTMYQRQQEMFDGSYQTFELAQMKDVVKVILIQDDKIIMIHDEQPGYSKLTFAGGFIESGEDKEQAVRREVLEETGYEIVDLQFWFYTPFGNRVRGGRYYYIAHIGNNIQAPQPDQGGERITVLYKSFDEFIQYVCSDDSFSDFSSYVLKQYLISDHIQALQDILFDR